MPQGKEALEAERQAAYPAIQIGQLHLMCSRYWLLAFFQENFPELKILWGPQGPTASILCPGPLSFHCTVFFSRLLCPFIKLYGQKVKQFLGIHRL